MERVGDKVRWRAKRLGDFMTGKVVFALKSFNQMDMRGMREFAREAAIMRERIRDLGKEFRRYDGEIKGEDDEGVPESTEPEKRERKRRHIVTEPDNEQS
jgi:hypothetical protein